VRLRVFGALRTNLILVLPAAIQAGLAPNRLVPEGYIGDYASLSPYNPGCNVERDIAVPALKEKSGLPQSITVVAPDIVNNHRAVVHLPLCMRIEINNTASDDLVGAARRILSKKRYISPDFARKMLFDFESAAEKPAHQEFSTRELQVMSRIVKVKAPKQIAEGLRMSANTERIYGAPILEKTGLKGTNELIS
jgi:DNA-binding CsgD family transcriptional regulator